MNADGAISDSSEYGETQWYIEHLALLVSTSKWAMLGALTGALVGLATRVFLWALSAAGYEANRLSAHGFAPYWLLPLALIASVWLVRTFAPDAKGHGTEAVIEAIHERSGQIDAKVAPVKLIATVLTLAFGGSVGKEGPCAQIGAAITSSLADLLRINAEDRRRLVICGIGAGFAAVFGTPVSGALFGIEVLFLGRIEYGVLFPCLVAGIVSHLVCGTQPHVAHLAPGIIARVGSTPLVLLSVVFGGLCGLVALLTIEAMNWLGHWLIRFKQQRYLVAAVGGIALACCYRAFGVSYSGLGLPTIDQAMGGIGKIALYAFLIKIIVTSITLEVGGSGGIITPLFFIGATLGSGFAEALHLPNALFASFGFVALVGAATNTPIALSVMSMELLPGDVGVYAALCTCTAYLMVGHRSVYASQRMGVLKTVALDMAGFSGPVGKLRRGGITVRPGTITDRLYGLSKRRRRADQVPVPKSAGQVETDAKRP